jgi:hypothetical protein
VTTEVRAGLIVVLLVVFAAGVGVAAGQRARPSPTPRPLASPTTIALPTATPADPAEVQRRAFAQPLMSGCAAGRSVWLVADGGAAIRWDGQVWSIPDPTLRSLVAAECDRSTLLAVGRGGSLLTIDEERRQVRADRFGIDDLNAVARVSGGAVAVGAAGTVVEQGDLGWRLVAAGATEDLHGVAILRSPSGVTGWIVGANGATYRFSEGRWTKVDSGMPVTLHAVVHVGEVAVAVGDEGRVLQFVGGRWETLLSSGERRPGTAPISLRGIATVGARTFWAVGDRGMAIEVTLSDPGGARNVRPIDLGTTCTLRDVFADGSAIWVVGSDGTRGGAWRILPTGTDRWGTC